MVAQKCALGNEGIGNAAGVGEVTIGRSNAHFSFSSRLDIGKYHCLIYPKASLATSLFSENNLHRGGPEPPVMSIVKGQRVSSQSAFSLLCDQRIEKGVRISFALFKAGLKPTLLHGKH